MRQKPAVPFEAQRAEKEFFQGDTISVAKKLLGCVLVRAAGGPATVGKFRRPPPPSLLAGKIVETEAYLGLRDECCHSFNGRRTARTEAMYLPAGHAYIYFIYGACYCFNIVTGNEKEPEAVLIRALEPIQGLRRMSRNRERRLGGKGGPRGAAAPSSSLGKASGSPSVPFKKFLTSGPGRLSQALNLTSALNGAALFGPSSARRLFILKGESLKGADLVSDFRVGLPLANDHAFLPLRFYIKGNPFVSKNPRPLRPAGQPLR